MNFKVGDIVRVKELVLPTELRGQIGRIVGRYRSGAAVVLFPNPVWGYSQWDIIVEDLQIIPDTVQVQEPITPDAIYVPPPPLFKIEDTICSCDIVSLMKQGCVCGGK